VTAPSLAGSADRDLPGIGTFAYNGSPVITPVPPVDGRGQSRPLNDFVIRSATDETQDLGQALRIDRTHLNSLIFQQLFRRCAVTKQFSCVRKPFPALAQTSGSDEWFKRV
jgi:hypothetical protein